MSSKNSSKNIIISSCSGEPFSSIHSFMKNAEKEVVILSPYLKIEALKKLSFDNNINITVVTCFKLLDLQRGASDIGLYDYARENGIQLYINNRIHLKAYIKDWTSFIFGSSNLTNSGLALNNSFNFELNGYCKEIGFETLVYFKSLLHDSCQLNEKIVREAEALISNLPKLELFNEILLSKDEKVSKLTIDNLPRSKSIQDLYKIVLNGFKAGDREQIEAAVHDCVIFKVHPEESYTKFKEQLRTRFFNSTLVSKLLEFISYEGKYFGEVKNWVRKNCAEEHVIFEDDLTKYIQVIYSWLEELSNGEYVIERPNHSQRIYRRELR